MASTPRIVQILPQTPPAVNGLGDYGRMLQRHWPSQDVEWHVASPLLEPGAESVWPGVTFHGCKRDARSLCDALLESGAETAILQYVPHGYHRKGIPLWLLPALSEWKRRTNGRLAVFFHESFAYPPPFRTIVWTPASWRVMRGLVNLAGVVMTSNGRYQGQLRFYGGAPTVELMPIAPTILPPNVFRPDTGPPWTFTVFGREKTRITALREYEPFLRAVSQAGLIREIRIVGMAGEDDHPDVDIAQKYGPTTLHANLPEVEASNVMATCNLGLAGTDLPRIGKSSVFAAYVACKIVPVALASRPGPFLPAWPAERAVELLRRSECLEAIQGRVAEYARKLDWHEQARRWKELVDGMSPDGTVTPGTTSRPSPPI